MRPAKSAVAYDLADHHFRVEPGLEAVFVLESPDEEPIRMLEVNSATPASGRVEVFRPAQTAATPYAIAIAEVTPEELARTERGELALPNGWSLETATRRNRPRAG